MTQSELIKSNLVNKLLAIEDNELLMAIDLMISKLTDKNPIQMSKEEIQGIVISEKEFNEGVELDHAELIRQEHEWLRGQ